MKTYDCHFAYLPYPRILVTEDFINDNALSLSRPVDCIIEKLQNGEGLFEFASEILIDYLPWNSRTIGCLKDILTDEAFDKYVKSPSLWKFINDIPESAQNFLDYMVFAWGKAVDQRGLSASRSIEKLSTYLWLFGRDDLVNIIDNDDLYNPYGMPALIAVCDKMKIAVPEECIEFAKNKCE